MMMLICDGTIVHFQYGNLVSILNQTMFIRVISNSISSLFAKYAKHHEQYESKFYGQYFIKTVRAVPGRPHEGPNVEIQFCGEKYVSTKFQQVCAE